MSCCFCCFKQLDSNVESESKRPLIDRETEQKHHMKQPLKTKPTPVQPRDFCVTLPPPSPNLKPDRVVYDPNDKGYISKTGFSLAAQERGRVVTLWTFIPRNLSPLRQNSTTWTPRKIF